MPMILYAGKKYSDKTEGLGMPIMIYKGRKYPDKHQGQKRTVDTMILDGTPAIMNPGNAPAIRIAAPMA